jgi:hypothetical protein
MKTRISIFVLLVTTILLAGCQSPKPAALTNDQVIQDVNQFLQAASAGDYQRATNNFSDTMKSVYSEAQFNHLRDLLGKASGHFAYCSNEKPSLTNSQGYAIYHLICKFELEDVAVTISFKIGGTQIEGLYFSSTGLLKLTK